MKLFSKALIAVAFVFGLSSFAGAAQTFTKQDGGLQFYSFDQNENQDNDFMAVLATQGYDYYSKFNVGDPDYILDGEYEGPIFDITVGDDGTSGTWSSTQEINAFVIKGSGGFLFVDYNLLGAGTSNGSFGDNWCTDASCTIGGVDLSSWSIDDQTAFSILNSSGRPQELSHLTLYALEITSVIPEPATWLMMVMGFGMVGVATRRRRKMVLS